MISVNPRINTISNELIEAYRAIVPASLGHVLDSGLDAAIHAIWKPVKLVGPALTVQTYPQVDTAVSRALEIARPGDVLVLNRGGDTRIANWGEFAAVGAIEAGVVGLVSDGVVTDQSALRRLNFPAFARGVTALTIKRRGVEEGAVNVPVTVGGIVICPGDLVIADEDGVVIVPPGYAAGLLGFCQELEEREAWMRTQLEDGRTYSDLRNERPMPRLPDLMLP